MATSFGDGWIEPGDSINGSENLDNDLLADLDSYLEDLHDRLTISRMVSDSVLKGMVNAVTEEAEGRISLKESEVALLEERLQFHESGADKIAESGLSSFSDTVVELDSLNLKECLGNLRIAEEEQFQRLEKEIEDMKGCSSIQRLNSDSELPGLRGILPGKVSEKCVEVNKTLDTLKNVLKTVYELVDCVVHLSKPLLCEWQQEREFQEELEATVIRTSIRSLQEEFEAMLWEQRAQCCSSQSINQLAKINELSILREELDAIYRSLSSPEMEQLPYHGSHEGGEEWNNAKRKDHLHCEVLLSNHTSPPNSPREGNGKHEESKNTMTMDSAQLKHMSNDDLISYFEKEMTNMKRNHESVVSEITEKYFRLEQRFLYERGPSLSLRKDEEFDAFRKKIPDVILKLDDMLMENVELPVTYDNIENRCGLKDRLDTLLSKNGQIRNLFINKGNEVKGLSSQVSDAADKMSNPSLAEENLLKHIRKLKCEIEDTKIEASVREDIYNCVLGEAIGKIKWEIEDSDMESITIQEIHEIIFREAVKDANCAMKWDIEDSDMESSFMLEMCGIIFREAVKDAEATINLMKMKYEKENERRVSLEASILDSEEFLSLEIKEKEWLKQEMFSFSSLMEEKENVALEVGSSLMKEKGSFDLVYQEFNRLGDQASSKERLISESSKESNLIKSKLEQALEKMRLYEEEISKLDQKLKLAMKDLKESNEERRMLHDIIQEKKNIISSFEAKEIEHMKQIESIISSVQRLSITAFDFECRTMKKVEKNILRLEKWNLHCNPLVQKAKIFKRMELVYKQRLKRRYYDLQKAEAENEALQSSPDLLKRRRFTLSRQGSIKSQS